ncbi:MAG: 30S ribosome-binding factor RbfA [Myxococcota bacterium]
MIPKRLARVGETIRAEISDMLLRDIKDPGIGFVTITDVVMSPDLKHARVYFSRMGTEEDVAASQAGLMRAAGFFRRQLGRRLRLKYAPELRFEHDSSLETGARIDALLKEIE